MNRKELLCFLLLLAAKPILPQNDSLLQVYRHAKTFEQKLESGNELIFTLRFENRPLAANIAASLVNDKQIRKYPEAHARAWIRRGILYDLSNNADSAVICNEKALAIASKDHLPKQKASALNNLGLIYWNNMQLDKATGYITRASAEFEKNGDTLNLANALNNLGLIMNEFTFREKAAAYHRKALALFKKAGDKYGIGSALHNIAFSQRSTDSARYYYYQTLAWQKSINDLYGLAKTYNDLAISYDDINHDSTKHYYNLAIEYHRKTGNAYGEVSALFSYASFLFLELHELNQSLKLATESARLAEQIGNTKLFWKAEKVLAAIYQERGEFEKSAFHYRRTVNLRDSVMSEENLKTSQQLEFKYNVSQKEKQLAEQKAKNARKDKIIAQKESQNKTFMMILIVIVFAALLIIAAVMWYFKQHRLKNQRRHAQQLAEEREKSLQQTLIAQEEERQRIAKDLHDGIVQDLAAIKMRLEQAVDSATGEQKNWLDSAKNNLEKTTKEVRSISHQMMPTALRELGLVEALSDNLQKIFPLHNIRHEFYAHGINERLPEKVEISLYRIAQELINNVTRHSKATEVSVSLTLINHVVTMHFEDNGTGFDPSASSGGIGLTNLQSRVRIVNGEIRYESSEGQGTVAIIRVPVK